MHYFLIGPGGVGKSSTAPYLAELLHIPFLDLDEEYMKRGNIARDIKEKGYEYYYKKNSSLFFTLLDQANITTLFVLSSGFMVYPDESIVRQHHTVVEKMGRSILLLPSKDIAYSATIVVERQLQRGFSLNKEHEYFKFKRRFLQYKDKGDIQIFSVNTPKRIAKEIYRNIRMYEGKYT